MTFNPGEKPDVPTTDERGVSPARVAPADETILFDIDVDARGNSREGTAEECRLLAFLETVTDARIKVTIEVFRKVKAS